jgi:hypothetical protein
MKRILSVLLVVMMLVTVAFTGCGKAATTEETASTAVSAEASAPAAEASSAAEPVAAPAVADDASVKVLNLWSFTDEVPKMVDKYKAAHPDFPYEVKTTIIATTDGAYQPALDQALAAGGENAPDIYTAEAAFVLKYTQGDAYKYAAAYKDLGIDVDNALKAAEIAPYVSDIGTNPDGNLIGLAYQATGGAYIYRRSIAKAVWGTDDPAVRGEESLAVGRGEVLPLD